MKETNTLIKLFTRFLKDNQAYEKYFQEISEYHVCSFVKQLVYEKLHLEANYRRKPKNYQALTPEHILKITADYCIKFFSDDFVQIIHWDETKDGFNFYDKLSREFRTILAKKGYYSD